MKTLKLLNYARDSWIAGDGGLAAGAQRGDRRGRSPQTGSGGLDFRAMLDHARDGRRPGAARD